MSYILQNPGIVLELLLEHLQMTGIAIGVAVVIAVPIAWIMYRFAGLQRPIMGILGVIYTIPSLALMILLIPLFGLSAITAIVAMILYAQVILVRSIVVGLQSVPPPILEAAQAMGMTPWQCWWQVQVPLMCPVLLAGVRLATTVMIALGTVAAKFGAGGLGELLFEGIAQAGRYDKIWAGTIVVSGVAIVANILLWLLEQQLAPKQPLQRGR
ncbi:ABC transporter permease [Acaryochloris sp. IP29b_bin.137]|uniref:ABC transporter permease n=1 Tax=Acaryochloris sp. IP29b_bin.137 TaxID=2969217 RepID=UPI00260A01C9|nr:ABC transporter permease [Acaryochloris sp. IP29b_bin.137]